MKDINKDKTMMSTCSLHHFLTNMNDHKSKHMGLFTFKK